MKRVELGLSIKMSLRVFALSSLLVIAFIGSATDRLEPRVVPIRVSGTVVDAQGRPLRAVTMTVKESRAQQGTLEWTASRRLITVDGAFDVVCQDCSDLRLRFQSEGFFPKEISFELTEVELEALMLGDGGDDFSIVRPGLVVRLDACAAPANLVWTSATLDLLAEGSLRVLAQENGRLTESIEREVLRKRQKAGAANDLAMVALATDPGSFDNLVQMATGYESEPGAQTELIIDFSGSETGVIPVDGPLGGPREVFRSLIEAPEDGYGDHLTIAASSDREQYFYCRIGGLYGKGRVSPLRAAYGRDSVRTLEVGLEIYVNPDGTRNLEALDY